MYIYIYMCYPLLFLLLCLRSGIHLLASKRSRCTFRTMTYKGRTGVCEKKSPRVKKTRWNISFRSIKSGAAGEDLSVLVCEFGARW